MILINMICFNKMDFFFAKYLYDELEKMQPNLIKLATETDDNDDSIGDILKTNDACESLIKRYQIVIGTNYSTFNNDDALVNLNLNENESVNSQEQQKPTTAIDATKELQDLFCSVDLNPSYSNIKTNIETSNNIFDDLKLLEQQSNSLQSQFSTNSFVTPIPTSNSLNSFSQLAPLQPQQVKTTGSESN
jgi:hypothetical protein